MSISPIITFKAGRCELNTSTTPARVRPDSTPGYIYLYSEDDLIHFCWRARSAPLDAPELDLMMVPTDGSFKTYEDANGKKPTNGRIYALKFSSSSQRHLFWLQSQSQHPAADSAFFSARDRKLGDIVNTLLQGEDIDVQQEIANLPPDQEGPDGDNDEAMEDVEGQDPSPDHHRGGSGGAGPGATGGDVREEGHGAREGGADGGRAASTMDPNTIIQNFLQSMQGSKIGERGQEGAQSGAQERLFTTLADLLTPASTLPILETADNAFADRLLEYLPPTLISLAQEADDDTVTLASDAPLEASSEAITLNQKKDILRRVLRSPQFAQSLSSLTIALRDGGLPSVSEALGIPVKNGGFMRHGGMPMGGGDAVEAFLDGVKDRSEAEKQSDDRTSTD